MSELADSVTSFKAEYGRLCVLIALALMDGHGRNAVIEAAQGLSLPTSDLMLQIRRQRDRANNAYYSATRLGAGKSGIVEIARQARRTVSSEFMVEIPILRSAVT